MFIETKRINYRDGIVMYCHIWKDTSHARTNQSQALTKWQETTNQSKYADPLKME
jgi:hypothetical protein